MVRIAFLLTVVALAVACGGAEADPTENSGTKMGSSSSGDTALPRPEVTYYMLSKG